MHRILQPARVDGAGREWFRTGLSAVLAAIAQSMQSGDIGHHTPTEDPAAAASRGVSASEDDDDMILATTHKRIKMIRRASAIHNTEIQL